MASSSRTFKLGTRGMLDAKPVPRLSGDDHCNVCKLGSCNMHESPSAMSNNKAGLDFQV